MNRRETLDSWKEIAEYLGRDVRTAIRWEHERGLPVHRMPGGRRGGVFAYAEEIDRWRRGQPSDDTGSDLASRAPAGPDSPPPGAGVDAAPGRAAQGGRARRSQLVFVAMALVAVPVVAGLLALMPVGRPAQRSIGSARLGRLDFGPREVTAWTDAGEVAWRHEFPGGLLPVPSDARSKFAITDVDGDAEQEIVATVTLRIDSDNTQEELVCFSRRGDMKWRTRLEDRVTFRAGTFGPPWTAGYVAVYRLAGKTRIAWGQGHHTWWPGILTAYDGTGHRLSTFVNAGQIRALSTLDGPGGPLLLAGGINNAYRSACLAVLDGASVVGRSPVPAGSPYECTTCSQEMPVRYFLFPPSEILVASNFPYNHTRALRAVGDEVEVFTRESLPDAPLAELIFRFSKDFVLLDARAADSWAAHEALRRAGKLDHSVADCPMYRLPPPVREWTPARGWRDLRPATLPTGSASRDVGAGTGPVQAGRDPGGRP